MDRLKPAAFAVIASISLGACSGNENEASLLPQARATAPAAIPGVPDYGWRNSAVPRERDGEVFEYY